MTKFNSIKIVPIAIVLSLLTIFGVATTFATGQKNMATKKICELTPVQRSQEMIRVILDDIVKQYTLPGGGGISKIRLDSTNVYIVSISQEERVDEITYEMDINEDCKAVIIKSSMNAITKNRH